MRSAVAATEDKRMFVVVLRNPMLDEVIAEYRGDRRATEAGRRLRLDRAVLLIPGALDADQAAGADRRARSARRPSPSAPSEPGTRRTWSP